MSAAPTNRLPLGHVDVLANGVLHGWTFDPDDPGRSLDVHVYVRDGSRTTIVTGARANGLRPDVNRVFGIPGNHGFQIRLPASATPPAGETWEVIAFAIDSTGGRNPQIGSPRRIVGPATPAPPPATPAPPPATPAPPPATPAPPPPPATPTWKGLLAPGSASASLGRDTVVGGTTTVLAQTRVRLIEEGPVVLHAVGNTWGRGRPVTAQFQIRVDGRLAGGKARMAFLNGDQRHPFLLNGVATLGPGVHTVRLEAVRVAGAGEFNVQATAQLSALVGFKHAVQQIVRRDVRIDSKTPIPVLEREIETVGPVLIEHAGTLRRAINSGDGMTNIFIDGQWRSSLGINDLVEGFDERAPVGALTTLNDTVPTRHRIGLRALKLFIPGRYENQVIFDVEPDTTLITAWGGVLGMKASDYAPDALVGDGSITVAPASFDLPAGHSGRVWVVAHGRWLEPPNTGLGGLEAARLEVDGRGVGAWVVQRFVRGATISQRNFALGYLATGLRPGRHEVRVRVQKALPDDRNHHMPSLVVQCNTVAVW